MSGGRAAVGGRGFMSERQRERPQNGPFETDDVQLYRPLSRLAVLAFALALTSPLALFHPLLWLLPVAAVCVAVAALVAIAGSDQTMAGRWLAVAALSLGAFFGGWAPAQQWTRQALLHRHGRQFAAEWLELVRDGKLHQAHQLHLPYADRLPPGDSLERFYQQDDPTLMATAEGALPTTPADDFRRLFQAPPLRDLVKLGRRGSLRYVGSARPAYGGGAHEEFVSEQFVLEYSQDGAERKLPLVVTLKRTWDDSRNAYWQVEDVTRPAGSS